MHNQTGIVHDTGGNRDFFLVVVQPITAAHNHLVFEDGRTPRETELWTDIVFLRRPSRTFVHIEAGEISRTGAWSGHIHIVFFRRERAKIRPAHAKIQSQIRTDFKVILSEEAPDVFAIILSKSCREAGLRIEIGVFRVGRIVEEVPNVKESIIGNAAAGALLQVEEPCDLTAKLDGVVPDNLGGHVLERYRSTGSEHCRHLGQID